MATKNDLVGMIAETVYNDETVCDVFVLSDMTISVIFEDGTSFNVAVERRD